METRFWSKVDASGVCWEWTRAKDRKGYGRYMSRENVLAHRHSYESLVGPIPDGMELDHLCLNRGCVNPDHLEVVTQAENKRRARVGKRAIRRTRCKRGHELTVDNRYVQVRDGKESHSCLTCRRSR